MAREQVISPEKLEFWQDIYVQGDPPWDEGGPAPPLVRAIEEAALEKGSRVLVPGCGFGYEAIFLARQGFEVTAVDFAPAPIAALLAQAQNLPLRALARDIFSLECDFPHYFDAVVEHTCFCAILPQRRDAYVQLMAAVLQERGRIIGLFFDIDKDPGPPFKTTREDIYRHFEPFFDIVSLSRPPDSFASRRGKEWLAELRRSPEVDRASGT